MHAVQILFVSTLLDHILAHVNLASWVIRTFQLVAQVRFLSFYVYIFMCVKRAREREVYF